MSQILDGKSPLSKPALHIGLALGHRFCLANLSKNAVLNIKIATLSPWCRKVSAFWNYGIGKRTTFSQCKLLLVFGNFRSWELHQPGILLLLWKMRSETNWELSENWDEFCFENKPRPNTTILSLYFGKHFQRAWINILNANSGSGEVSVL